MHMMRNNTILVLTQQLDFHADLVIAELNRRSVPVMRFDTADFPLRATLIAHSQTGSWDGAIVTENRSIAGMRPSPLITSDPFKIAAGVIPTGKYVANPTYADLIGADTIFATLPTILSNCYEVTLLPIELAHSVASLSTYPSTPILKMFAERARKGQLDSVE